MTKTLASAVAVAIATFAFMGGTAAASTSCSLVASPSGSDAARGTSAAPFQTVQRLVDSLSPGQTGCLQSGNYTGDVKFDNGGRAGAPITLTSAPGQSATITGRMWVPHGSDYVTVTGLDLVGVNADDLPSPTINAANSTFSYDEVSDAHTAICFAVGSAWGQATNTLITNDRIHDCGVLPAANHDHGIYVADAVNTTIQWNEIYDNADRGVQLYPNAQDTTVDHNIIADNGEGLLFSGDDGTASNNADVYDNVIAGAVIRHDVESYYPANNPIGTGNTLRDNCVWGGAGDPIDTSAGGFSSHDNKIGDPQFVNAADHDFHLRPGSPCLAMTGDVAAAVDGGPATSAAMSASARRRATPRKVTAEKTARSTRCRLVRSRRHHTHTRHGRRHARPETRTT